MNLAAKLALGAAALAFSLVAGEMALCILGYRAWQPEAPGFRVEPGGRLYRAHPTLGYAPIPGRFSVSFDSGLVFHAEHDQEGHRIAEASDRLSVSPLEARERPEVWVFGGSFTYGWAIDDEESFPWRLQERMPELKIRNFGVPGYGTVHAWVELVERLSTHSAPACVVIAYASFHDVRNAFARERRKRVAPYNQLGPLVQPYGRVVGPGEVEVEMAEVAYAPWPGMRHSALIHLLEARWNEFERSRLDESKLTLLLLRDIARRSRQAGSRTLLVTLTLDRRAVAVRAFARNEGMEIQDLGINLDRPGYRNHPHDGHPSAKAAEEYAALLEDALRAGGR